MRYWKPRLKIVTLGVRGVGSLEGDSLKTPSGAWEGAALGRDESRRVPALPRSARGAGEAKVWLAALLPFSDSCFGMVCLKRMFINACFLDDQRLTDDWSTDKYF